MLIDEDTPSNFEQTGSYGLAPETSFRAYFLSSHSFIPWHYLLSRNERETFDLKDFDSQNKIMKMKKITPRMGNLLPSLCFLTLHHSYYIIMCLFWSVILWASTGPTHSVSYVDSLFLCSSAMTGTGLNTINLSTINSFQQAILFGLILLGHPILISSTLLFVRKRSFETKFKNVIEAHVRKHSAVHQEISLYKIAEKILVEDQDMFCSKNNDLVATHGTLNSTPLQSDSERSLQTNIRLRGVTHVVKDTSLTSDDQITVQSHSRDRVIHEVFPVVGVGAHVDAKGPEVAAPAFIIDEEKLPPLVKTQTIERHEALSSDDFISPNSQFYSLTAKERAKLGGVEYKAICFLSIIVPLYFVIFNILGFVGIGSWIAVNKPDAVSASNLNLFWIGSFLAISAFGNNGMSLLDLNMTVLQTDIYVLLTMAMLILAGNTFYPCLLRFIIWTMKYVLTSLKWCEEWIVVLNFILEHPRRVYTHLFPKRHTWYLFGTVIFFNVIGWAGFLLLSIGNSSIESLGSYRVLDGLFQGVAVRTGGFYVVSIADLHQGLLVLYVIMMFVSAYPILITIRNTNIYEERSIGIYANDHIAKDQQHCASLGTVVGYTRTYLFPSSDKKHQVGSGLTSQSASHVDESYISRSYFIYQQLKSQFNHDVWWVFIAVLFIAIAEAPHFTMDPISYSTFNIIFEVVSAYGCVGVSVGLPNQNYSFCGGWFTISKLILIAVMLRGRHRGLPVAIDKAVMLSEESLALVDEEDTVLEEGNARNQNAVHGTSYDEKADDIV